MPITFLSGVEGSGKTALMTHKLLKHYESGGRIMAFPGYELYGRNKREILSETIMPWEILDIVNDDDPKHVKEIRKQRIIVVIDEVTNFVNNHFWHNKISDVIAAIAQQRRKLNIAMMMSGHERYRLPPNIEEKVHQEIICIDAHRFNRELPLGQIINFRYHDLRGMLSHPRYPYSKLFSLDIRHVYKHYNTFSVVSILHMFDKYKFQGKEIKVSADGKIIDTDGDYEEMPAAVSIEIDIASKVEELRENGIDYLSVTDFDMLLGDMGLENTPRIKRLFRSRGLGWDSLSQGYVLKTNNILAGVA